MHFSAMISISIDDEYVLASKLLVDARPEGNPNMSGSVHEKTFFDSCVFNTYQWRLCVCG
jgi:hypothetical protein